MLSSRGINNLIKVIEKGVLSDAVTNRLTELENKKTGIEEAIETEKLKQALVEDENSIKKYFEMYAKADFDDEDTRNRVLEYFVDKIYVYNDRLVITGYYSDDETSIYLDALTEVSSSGTDKRAKSSTSLLSAPLNEAEANTRDIFLGDSVPLKLIKSYSVYDIIVYRNICCLVYRWK